ncbi:Nucleoside-diphosphate-sugar epimerase [Sphingomonas sp. YR710]|uniref:SDR family oxidoreductase n=1 Tax=Sphingomonas sp. YR710 TaxID=1882773 RepID=UPI000886201F|nr:NAD(P)H-binding protein [Sphingomonas sp. YR710]SDC74147.1 Nucleoside-diphosphate-sugar epimerase [Sphingomonas sp. YR710]
MTLLAITGATGFVGGHVLRVAAERGHQVRALARGPQLPRARVEWVQGALDRPESLVELVEGADAVIHIAGAINAADLAGFVAANVTGTATMVTAAEAAGVSRFIHVSSLSAREPDLSDYGWSKSASEAVLRQSQLDWTIVRPPAIYGEGDREMLELFRLAAKGLVPLPPRGRLSLIEAGDLARLLVDLVDDADSIGQTFEPDDGTPNGYSHREFGRLLGQAVGRGNVMTVPVPAFALKLGALYERLRHGPRAKLTPDRVRYFCHPDWVCTARPPEALWRAHIGAADGLAATAEWYRGQRWLPPAR